MGQAAVGSVVRLGQGRGRQGVRTGTGPRSAAWSARQTAVRRAVWWSTWDRAAAARRQNWDRAAFWQRGQDLRQRAIAARSALREGGVRQLVRTGTGPGGHVGQHWDSAAAAAR